MKYETVRYNLTPVVDGPFVGYGVDVDKAWDSIANDSRQKSLSIWHIANPVTDLSQQWATR